MRRTASSAHALLCLPVLLAGCGGGASSSGASPTATPAVSTPALTPTEDPSPTATPYTPVIVPADYSATIDNPFLPLAPGTRLTYSGTAAEGKEDIVVTVLRQTRLVMGVRCVVVRDTVSVKGTVIEDTYDWYAQDKHGTVWYFGEDTKEFEDGRVVSTKGTWEAGVKGAQPGVVMPAVPRTGDRFRQEYAIDVAEDEFLVLDTAATATLASGKRTGLVETEDTSRIIPDEVEHKYYERGVGFVLVVHVKGPAERIELVRSEHV